MRALHRGRWEDHFAFLKKKTTLALPGYVIMWWKVSCSWRGRSVEEEDGLFLVFRQTVFLDLNYLIRLMEEDGILCVVCWHWKTRKASIATPPPPPPPHLYFFPPVFYLSGKDNPACPSPEPGTQKLCGQDKPFFFFFFWKHVGRNSILNRTIMKKINKPELLICNPTLRIRQQRVQCVLSYKRRSIYIMYAFWGPNKAMSWQPQRWMWTVMVKGERGETT